VELGLQTIHDETAKRINRGHDFACFLEAVDKLRKHGIRVCAHIIHGLPGETEEMMLETVKACADMDIQGIKIHLLHVLKNTRLSEMYFQGIVSTLSFAEYACLLGKCINRLPSDIVIHRITGDGNKNSLIAPLWSADKKHVLNSLKRYFEKENIIQGKNVLDNAHN